MEFEVITTPFFRDQVEDLDEKSKRIIADKLRLLKLNPFRYKRLHSNEYSRVYRVRLTLRDKSMRMIYAVVGNHVKIIGLDDRNNNYADLDNLIKKYLHEPR